MGKPTEDKLRENDRGTNIIFKKSVNTLYSHTRTSSMMSEFVSQTSKETKKDQNFYYSDRRDMSTETVMCKLRRYCKSKTNKMYNHRSSIKSTKEDTEVDTIVEYPDTSACGDNEIAEISSRSPINIQTLLIDNLKNLLNKCIQNNLLESKHRQQKLETVLNSILHNLNNKNHYDTNSMGKTSWRIEQENKSTKQKISPAPSGFYQHSKRKRCSKAKRPIMIYQKDSSSITIPCHCKNIRGISTLSIPRSFHKRRREKKSKHNLPSLKSGKIKPNDIILSIGRSTKILDSSSFDLLAISTKSLTNRSVNYDFNVKKKHIVFLPKASHSDVKENTTKTLVKSTNSVAMNKEQLFEMPSLLRSLYGNDPAAVTNSDKGTAKNDNFTMTETVSKEVITHNNTSHITMTKNIRFENNKGSLDRNNHTGSSNSAKDCIKPRNEFSKNTSSNTTEPIRIKTTHYPKRCIRKGRTTKRRRHIGYNLTKDTGSNNTVNNFNVLFKKVNSQIQRQQENIQKQFENLFNYCTEYNNSKKIKVDVRINVFPYEYKTKDVSAGVRYKSLDAVGTNEGLKSVEPTILESAEPKLKLNPNNQSSKTDLLPVVLDVPSKNLTKTSLSHCGPQIFTLLDGANSQAKYMFAVSSREESEGKKFVLADNNSVISKDGLQQKISDSKTATKEVITLVSKSLPANNTCPSAILKYVAMNHNPSKETQVLIDMKQKEPNTKERKDPTKKVFEFYNRLGKKSTSYRIIDSESILKVTDMTSKADEINNGNHLYDQALMCCLPKSRSLFEMKDNTNKLIAFFCGNQVKPDGKSAMPSPYACNMCCTTSSRSKFSGLSNNLFQQQGDSCIVSILPDTDGNYSTTFSDQYTSSLINEDGSEELCKVCKRRKRRGCCLGLTFCLLIWVPIIILVYFFYTYDLKDWMKIFQTDTEIEPEENVDSVKNPNRSYVKLSVLGF